MSIFPKTTRTGATALNLAGLGSNEAGADNVLITENDLSTDGLNYIMLVSPNGTKYKLSVANNGTVTSTAA